MMVLTTTLYRGAHVVSKIIYSLEIMGEIAVKVDERGFPMHLQQVWNSLTA